MAEPKLLDLENVHPCEPGHGIPKGFFYAWRAEEAAYSVVCARCGRGTMEASTEQAVRVWNEAHPERELTPEEKAGQTVVADMQKAMEALPRQYLCDEGIHIIQRLAEGGYACAQCGLGFREHHALDITTGVTALAQSAS